MKEQWEQDIISKLKQFIEWAGVLPYPERPTNYFVKHGVGEILVRYERTRYSEGDAPQYYQNCTVHVELIFVWRRLRGKDAGAQGLYYTVDAVRDCLYGFKPSYSSSGIQFNEEEMIGENNGIWQYGMKINFGSVYVKTADLEQDVDPVIAKSIDVKTIEDVCSACSNG